MLVSEGGMGTYQIIHALESKLDADVVLINGEEIKEIQSQTTENIFDKKDIIRQIEEFPMIVQEETFLTEREFHKSRRKPKNSNWQNTIKKLQKL